MTTADPRRPGCLPQPNDEQGSSPVTAIGSLAIFLGFLFVVVQVTVHLFASSTAGGIALEAASRAARSSDGPAVAVAGAESWARAELAGWPSVSVSCSPPSVSPGRVTCRVSGTSPATSMRLFSSLSGLDTIAREASVRVEAVDATP